MDFTFPEKFFQAAKYFDHYTAGDLEETDLLDNDHKLMFHALRKQAEEGPCDVPAPAFWHVTERYKHQAWCRLGRMSKFEAMVLFVKQLEQLLIARSGATEICWMEKIKELPGEDHQGEHAPLVPELQWDADLVAHRAATPANIAFLASLVMALRTELAEAHARETAKESEAPMHPAAGCGLRSTENSSARREPGRDGVSLAQSHTAAVRPPLRGPATVRMTVPAVRPSMPPVKADPAETVGPSAEVCPPMKPSVTEALYAQMPPLYVSPQATAEAPAAEGNQPSRAGTPSSPAIGSPTTGGWGWWLWGS